MKLHQRTLQAAVMGIFVLGLGGPALAQNPCAPKAKNPCATSDRIDSKLITRPKGTKLLAGNQAEFVKVGEKLWNDPKLGNSGLSCNTCHQGGGAFQAGFAKPYPHTVAMARDKAGVKTIQLDEMVQACMVMPMAGKPLGWDSRELAALTAYTAEVQKHFKPAKAAAKNPCAAANPCAAKK